MVSFCPRLIQDRIDIFSCFRLAQLVQKIAKALMNSDADPRLIGQVQVSERLEHIILINSFYYIGSAEGHEYPNLQVGDEVNPRRFFALTHIDQPLLLLK